MLASQQHVQHISKKDQQFYTNFCAATAKEAADQFLLFVSCLMSQQHPSASQAWICSDKCTYCHTETEVADQSFYLTQSQYTDTGPTSPSTDPISTRQGSHWSVNFQVTGMTQPGKIPMAQAGIEPRISCCGGGRPNLVKMPMAQAGICCSGGRCPNH